MNINKLLYDPEDFGINHYQWRTDRKLDVFESVNLSNRGLDSLPFSFGRIEGEFSVYSNQLSETSFPDFPEECYVIFASNNLFKSMTGFGTKTGFLDFDLNPLESISGIKSLNLDTLYLRGSNIKDWDNLPNVSQLLDISDSSVVDLGFLKNKQIKEIILANTGVSSLEGVNCPYLIDIQGTNINSLKGLIVKPKIILCEKRKVEVFKNELKEAFPYDNSKIDFL